jgi:hypothetical protein
MFRTMEVGDRNVVEEHEATWQLIGVPLKDYTPKVSCNFQIVQYTAIMSIIQHSSTIYNTWKTMGRKDIMPKMRSLL